MGEPAPRPNARIAVKTPEAFTFKVDQWKDWKKKFMRFRSVTMLDGDSDERQINTLIYVMGQSADDIFEQLSLETQIEVAPATDPVTYRDRTFAEVMEAFGHYFEPRSNYRHYRIQFGKRQQLADENSEAYVRELYALAGKCNFERASSKEDRIADQILAGMRDKDLSLELQIDSLELGAIIDRIRAKEILSNHQKSVDVDEVRQPQQGYRNFVAQGPQANRGGFGSSSNGLRNAVTDCKYCGRSHPIRQCPAYGKKCLKCGKQNHFAKCCGFRGRVSDVTVGSNDEQRAVGNQEFIVSDIVDSINKQTNIWLESVFLDDSRSPVSFKVDTGSQVNLIDISELVDVNVAVLPSVANLQSYTGNKIRVRGQVEMACQWKGAKRSISFQVVDGYTSILGLGALVELGIVSDSSLNVSSMTAVVESSVAVQITQPLVREFSDIFMPGIGKLDTTHHITLKPDARPYCAATRQVPEAQRCKLLAELARLMSEDVIEKVDAPSEWVHPIVVVDKPATGTVRICLDPRVLNQAVLRERFTLPAPSEIFSRIGESKYFSTLDATSGFYQIPLDEPSQLITTFITPFGRYKFKRLPFGVSSAPEVFHKYLCQSLEGIPGVEVFIDDVLIHGKTVEEHNVRLRLVFEKLRLIGMRLNESKCQIGKREVNYLGHVLSERGLTPMNSKIQAVVDMKVPENQTEVRRFLGFMTYLQKFCPHIAEVTEPLRMLIRKNTMFTWEVAQQQAFEECKRLVTNSPTLKLFEAGQPLKLSVDASGSCLGAVLLQGDRPVEYAAKSLNETQQRYSSIEKELLAIVYGCTRFHYYLYGRSFSVETDHKPLVGIVGKEISLVSPRLQSMVLQLQAYDFVLSHTPGSQMYLADTLSRSVCVDSIELGELPEGSGLVFSSEKIRLKYLQDCREDLEMQSLLRYVREGWPSHRAQCGVTGRTYWSYRLEIHAEEDMLFYQGRWIVPLNSRKKILGQLHTGHSGVSKTCLKAKSTVFWPGITRDIENLLLSCSPCQEQARLPNKEPLSPSEVPLFPFEVIAADLCEIFGKQYLVIVDYYTKWVDVAELIGDTKTERVVQALYRFFSNFGIAKVIRSDNGPQFSSHEFSRFATKLGIEHLTSSPRFPRSNGMVERHIQTVKNMIKKCISEGSSWQLGLLGLRNTPGNDGLASPAKLAQGRSLKENVPVRLSELFPCQYDRAEVTAQLDRRAGVMKWHHDKTAGPQQATLESGATVRVRHNDEWVPGQVEGSVGPRSYIVSTQKGKMRRNRQHLRPSNEDLPASWEGRSGRPSSSRVGQNLVPVIVGQNLKPDQLSIPTQEAAAGNTRVETPEPSGDVIRSPQCEKVLPASRSGRPLKAPAWHKDYVISKV